MRNAKKWIAILSVFSLIVGNLSLSVDSQGKAKKPSLNKKKITINIGKTKKIKVKSKKKIKKTTWSLTKKGKKIVKLQKRKKKSVVVKGKMTGKATVKAKVKVGKKTYKLSCKVTVTNPATPNVTSSPIDTELKTTPTPTATTSATESTPNVTEQPTEPTKTPDEGSTPTVTATPTVKPTATPTPVVTPTPKPTATPTPVATATPTPTPIVSDNALVDATVKSNSSTISASVSNGQAIAAFTESTQYQEAKYTLANTVSLANVTKINYSLTVTGTPDSVCFKLYDSDGAEISKLTNYNKPTGSYSITPSDEVKDKTIAGFGIMTNSNITGTQTATATLTSLTFEMSGSSSGDSTEDEPDTSNLETITMSADTFLGSGAIDGNPTYNSDGSVTFTATQNYGGGGIGICLNTSKTAVDLSDYLQVIFTVSSDVETPIALNYFTAADYWGARSDITYSTATTTQKVITCDIPQGSNICGFGIKFHTYGSDTSTLPTAPTFTIHSITLVKDSRDITNATKNYDSLYKVAEAYGFKMGTVMNTSKIADTKYANLMKYHFNSITAANEMKAYSMLSESSTKSAYVDETSMPVLDYTNADKIAAFAKENGIALRGHALVWDSGMKDWFFRVGYDTSKDYASKEVIQARLKNYIEQVVTHFEEKYPGVIYCWDVVNEAVGDSASDYAEGDARHVRTSRGGTANVFYETLGEDYVELSFQYTYEVVEKLKEKDSSISIDLYYNDYNTFYEAKRDAICELVKSINSYVSDGNGGYVKLCDGVGMQSYIGGYGSQSGCMNDTNITQVKTAIQTFAALGVDVQVTELAVRNYQDDDTTVTQHGEFYKKLFQAYIDVNSGDDKPLKAVSIWGIVDIPGLDPADYSYTMNGPYCGLFDENLAVKPSFVNIYNLMKGE